MRRQDVLRDEFGIKKLGQRIKLINAAKDEYARNPTPPAPKKKQPTKSSKARSTPTVQDASASGKRLSTLLSILCFVKHTRACHGIIPENRHSFSSRIAENCANHPMYTLCPARCRTNTDADCAQNGGGHSGGSSAGEEEEAKSSSPGIGRRSGASMEGQNPAILSCCGCCKRERGSVQSLSFRSALLSLFLSLSLCLSLSLFLSLSLCLSLSVSLSLSI